MIQPTKEREKVHIRWVCQHHSLQLHSCPSHMKETGLATKYLFHLFRLYGHVQVSSNHSSAQHYSCLGQALGSCNPTWLHRFQTPLPSTGESVCKLKGLPSPPFPTYHENIHTYIHVHGKWNESKKVFLSLLGKKTLKGFQCKCSWGKTVSCKQQLRISSARAFNMESQVKHPFLLLFIDSYSYCVLYSIRHSSWLPGH